MNDWPQTGVPGPAGPKGDKGDPGTSGGVSVFTVAIPAVASYTVSHVLGRKPASYVFYDGSGNECVVGLHVVDNFSFNILQDNPTSGTVIFT